MARRDGSRKVECSGWHQVRRAGPRPSLLNGMLLPPPQRNAPSPYIDITWTLAKAPVITRPSLRASIDSAVVSLGLYTGLTRCSLPPHLQVLPPGEEPTHLQILPCGWSARSLAASKMPFSNDSKALAHLEDAAMVRPCTPGGSCTDHGIMSKHDPGALMCSGICPMSSSDALNSGAGTASSARHGGHIPALQRKIELSDVVILALLAQPWLRLGRSSNPRQNGATAFGALGIAEE